MDKKELELLIENFSDKPVLRRYKIYIENKDMYHDEKDTNNHKTVTYEVKQDLLTVAEEPAPYGN